MVGQSNYAREEEIRGFPWNRSKHARRLKGLIERHKEKDDDSEIIACNLMGLLPKIIHMTPNSFGRVDWIGNGGRHAILPRDPNPYMSNDKVRLIEIMERLGLLTRERKMPRIQYPYGFYRELTEEGERLYNNLYQEGVYGGGKFSLWQDGADTDFFGMEGE